MLMECLFIYPNWTLGVKVGQGFAVKVSREAVDLAFVFPLETSVDLGYGDLSHEL